MSNTTVTVSNVCGVTGSIGTGISGLLVVPGATGPVGPTGMVGPQGFTGTIGATGVAGPTGMIGPQGPSSVSGVTAVKNSNYTASPGEFVPCDNAYTFNVTIPLASGNAGKSITLFSQGSDWTGTIMAIRSGSDTFSHANHDPHVVNSFQINSNGAVLTSDGSSTWYAYSL